MLLPLALAFNRDGHAFRVLPYEHDMCERAGLVFIGSVIGVESQLDPSPDIGISSIMTMEVERAIHGPLPEVVDIWTEGGTMGKLRLRVFEYPSPIVGARYLLFVYTTPQKRSRWTDRNPDITGAEPWSPVWPDEEHRFRILLFFKLDPDAELPPEEHLQAIWAEHCMQSKRRGKTLRPTQEYREHIPERFLQWCKHYRTKSDGR